jgi:hypothetical protein
VSIEILAPVAADGDDFSAAVRLRDLVRQTILERCGEPDLRGEHVVFTGAGIEHVDTAGA